MTEAGSVYGQALYDLAKSEGLTVQILKELDVLRLSFGKEPAFLKLPGEAAALSAQFSQDLNGKGLCPLLFPMLRCLPGSIQPG